MFYSAGGKLCVLLEIFLRCNAYQVTYFRVSLKRNDPSDAAKNDNFVTRVRKYPRCENAALWNLLPALISRQEIYAAQFKSQRCTRENFQPPKQRRMEAGQRNTTRNTTGCMHQHCQSKLPLRWRKGSLRICMNKQRP